MAGKKTLADILSLHSPHNPVTWVYDAVICGNASPIVGLLKVPEKRWKLSLATCETRAPQAVRWGLLRIWKVCLCSMETEWTLWVLYVDQAVYKGSGTSRPPARLYSTLTLFIHKARFKNNQSWPKKRYNKVLSVCSCLYCAVTVTTGFSLFYKLDFSFYARCWIFLWNVLAVVGDIIWNLSFCWGWGWTRCLT